MRSRLALLLLLLLAGLLALSVPARAHHRPQHQPRQRSVVNIYDLSDAYRPYVQWAADYYAALLAPYGVDVRYWFLGSLPWEQCLAWDWAAQGLQPGIRVCEQLDPDQTAGSSGQWWRRVDGVWYMHSNLYFHMPSPEGEDGMWGRYLTCHELGHSWGLSHTFDPSDPNCMSELGAYAWDYLTAWQVQEIVAGED